MTKKLAAILTCAVSAALVLFAQQSDIIIKLTQGDKTRLAVTDLRGAGEAQQFMGVFNQTLWNDLEGSGLFDLVPKSLHPLQVPQQPDDFKPPLPPRRRGGQPVPQGPWLTDWSQPPARANYLAFGYTAPSAGQMVLRGWFYNVTQADLSNAQVFGNTYVASFDEDGARKLAHDFAADILERFGGKSLSGSKIYYVHSPRPDTKEIWSMQPDGSGKTQITNYKSVSLQPTVSPDGTRLAFTSYRRGNPAIFVHSLETGRPLPFYNQVSSLVSTPEFTPDGKQLLFSISIGGWAQIAIANADGSNLRRLTYSRAIEVEPKVNPRTAAEVAFVSGRSGLPQIYRMNIEGTDARMLTDGDGYAANPAWHPDGQHLAFAWTRGYAPGNYNVFVMDVATRRFVQLTHGAGRNENPTWAPDGRHIVFCSSRTGSSQIWTMLADGTQLKQLTTEGRNTQPVWSRQ
jgi:TolB protein